jgi:hypothetical protein
VNFHSSNTYAIVNADLEIFAKRYQIFGGEQMRKINASIFLTIAFFTLLVLPAQADIDLTIKVVDEQGIEITGAKVKALTADREFGSEFEAITDKNGIAQINPLRTGNIDHTLEVSKDGFLSSTVTKYMKAWSKKTVRVSLRPDPSKATSIKKSPRLTITINDPAPNRSGPGPSLVTTPPVSIESAPGKSYALLFGTSEYQDTHWTRLPNPVLDVVTIAKELKSNYGFIVETLKNPTKKQILLKLREYVQKSFKPTDQLLIMFAGHGTFDDIAGTGHLVANDTQSPRIDTTYESYVSYPILLPLIDKIPNEHILLVADACFAGTLDPKIAEVKTRAGSDIYNNLSPDKFIQRKMKYKTRRYITSGGKTYVSDGRPGMHSPFVRQILEGLRGFGGSDGILTIDELLATYLDKVKEEPRWNEFGHNTPGSSFLFITRQ